MTWKTYQIFFSLSRLKTKTFTCSVSVQGLFPRKQLYISSQFEPSVLATCIRLTHGERLWVWTRSINHRLQMVTTHEFGSSSKLLDSFAAETPTKVACVCDFDFFALWVPTNGVRVAPSAGTLSLLVVVSPSSRDGQLADSAVPRRSFSAFNATWLQRKTMCIVWR